MNVTQAFILDRYSRLKEINGTIKVDAIQRSSHLEGSWRGRYIRIVIQYKNYSYNFQNVLSELEYTLQKIESSPMACNPILINKHRGVFAHSLPEEEKREIFCQKPEGIQTPQGAGESILKTVENPKKRKSLEKNGITFDSNDEVRFIQQKLNLFVKRHKPLETLKKEFSIEEASNKDKDVRKTKEELQDTLLRLYAEARAKLPNGCEKQIGERMKKLNFQRVEYTEDEFSEYLLTLGLEIKHFPSESALSYILKMPVKLKRLVDQKRVLIYYRIIDEAVLEKALPEFLAKKTPWN